MYSMSTSWSAGGFSAIDLHAIIIQTSRARLLDQYDLSIV